MSNGPTFLAARNNAAWCDAVCRVSGGATAFTPGLWFNARPSPPYFPNLVTLEPAIDVARVNALLQTLPADGAVIGVKDSFCTLDLSPVGFSMLFEASWIWREPAPPAATTPELRWTTVESPAGLQAWERAWHPGPGAQALAQPIFGPSLLQCGHISFLAAYQGSALVAGAAVTATEGTVGVACAFFRQSSPARWRRELLSQVAERHPGAPMLGYESGDELADMKALGFREVGTLRVWLGKGGR